MQLAKIFTKMMYYNSLHTHCAVRTIHPLTLTTFRLPFCAPPGNPGAPGAEPGAALASWAVMPALTVSIRTPVDIAGE